MHESKKSKKEKSLMVAIPESSPSVEVNIYNDGEKREGKADGGYSMMNPPREKAVFGKLAQAGLQYAGETVAPKAMKKLSKTRVPKEITEEMDELSYTLDEQKDLLDKYPETKERFINKIATLENTARNIGRGGGGPSDTVKNKSLKIMQSLLLPKTGNQDLVEKGIKAQRTTFDEKFDTGTDTFLAGLGLGVLYNYFDDSEVKELKNLQSKETDMLLNTIAELQNEVWLSQNTKPPTKKQASSFEKAFSTAWKANEKTFMFEGKEYTTQLARTQKFEGGPKSTFEGQGSPATPEALKQRDAREAAVVKEIQRTGEDDEVVLSKETLGKLADIEEGKMLIAEGTKLKDEARNNEARAYAENVRKQGQMILEGILNYTRDQNSLGGMIDDIQSQAASAATSNSKKPNIITAAPDLKTVAALDYATTTEGQIELDKQALDPNRQMAQEGGMAMPPELMQQPMPTEEPPVDTYPNIPPEEMAEVEASQLPDDEMEDDYLDFIVSESLSGQEQQYLMESLEADPQLSSIIDKLVLTASEFTGQGEVDGPGTGVSDSIPARLSDGEFVFTRKATDQLGADNLQTMMDDAERAYDGGLQKYALGGAVDDTVLGGAVKDTTPLMDEKVDMYGTNRQQDEMRKQMMYANRMPSIIGT